MFRAHRLFLRSLATALACWAVMNCAGARGAEPSASPLVDDDLVGLEPAVRPGTVLFLGELHGTVEAPAFAVRVAELALRERLAVNVGLEIPRTEAARVETYLASAGQPADRDRLLSGPFWQSSYQDGRRSEAMAKLLEDLRRHTEARRPVRVVCFDQQGAADREQAMTDALAGALSKSPRAFTIVLTGNLHARLNRSGRISDPMALRLARLRPESRFVALEVEYSGGTAWMCGSGGCGSGRVGGHDLGARPHLALDQELGSGSPRVPAPGDGFHGHFYAGEIHASPPAVAALRQSAAASPFQDPTQRLLDHAAPTVVPSGSRPPVPNVGEWPRWMGPGADGATEPGWLPLGVEVSLELDWRRPIGGGYSSISISGGQALTLEANATGVWLVALDVADGRELWRGAMTDPARSDGERLDTPSSTPAIGGSRVFAIHPAGLLFAFDAADGSGLWHRDLRELGASTPSYGMSTSPLLADGRLFALAGGREGYNLVGLDPGTGEILTALGPGHQGSYSTPVLVDVAGAAQLIVPAGDRLYGVEPRGGKPVWSHGGIPYPDRAPLVLPGGRVLMAFQEHAALFDVTPDSGTVRELWRSQQLAESYSPVVHHRGSLYGIGRGQLLCLDAASGKTLWQRRVGMGALIRIDDHLAFFDSRQGRLSLVAASPAGFEEVATLQVFGPGQHGVTAPSFGAGRIFVRGSKAIAAVRLVLPALRRVDF